MENRELLTLEKVAELLDVSVRTVQQRITDGTIRAFKLPGGRRLYVKKADLLAALEPVEPEGMEEEPISDEGKFFARVRKRAGDEEARLFYRLYKWAEEEGFDIDWGRGKQPRAFVPRFEVNGKREPLFWARTNGTVVIPFNRLNKYSFGAKRARDLLEPECRKRLKEQGIELSQPHEPWFYVGALSEEDVWDGFVRTMKWYANEFRKLKRSVTE